jgi:hypothetical protein
VALVTPIFKANENNEFKNYRPISVLTCFSKLLEKLMYKRLIKFIEKNKILTKHQYGFNLERIDPLNLQSLNLLTELLKQLTAFVCVHDQRLHIAIC